MAAGHRTVKDSIEMLESVLDCINKGDTEEAKNILHREINKRKEYLHRPSTPNVPVTQSPHLPPLRIQNRTSVSYESVKVCDPEPSPGETERTNVNSFVKSRNTTESSEKEVPVVESIRPNIVRSRTKARSNVIPIETNGETYPLVPNRTTMQSPFQTKRDYLENTRERQDESSSLPAIPSPIHDQTSSCEEILPSAECDTAQNVQEDDGNEVEEETTQDGRSAKQKKNFDMIAAEILQTERDYIRDLQIVSDVFIDSLEKGNIIPRNTVDALFSNWRSLLGINQELFRQLEEITCREQNIQGAEQNRRFTRQEPNVLVRVTFLKERASKTLLINTSHTGRDIIRMAIQKVITSLPSAEQKIFKSHYEYCELYDDNGTYSQNKSFLHQLPPTSNPVHVTIRKARKQANDIGECFLQMATYMQLYSEYCNNQVAAAKLLDKLSQENREFLNFIEACQYDNPLCRKRDLSSFLIIPLQRICKYPLLLKRLLENTPETCPEYETLKTATAVLTDAVQTINNKKRDIEGSAKMLSLQNNLICKDFELFAPSRKYICDDTAEAIVDGSFKEVTYFLFNDLLMTTTKNQQGKYTVVQHIEIIDAQIESVTGRPQAVSINGRPEEPVIVLNFPDLNQKSEFQKLVSDIIYEERKDRYHGWVTTQKLRGFVINKTLDEWLEMFFPSNKH